MKFTQSRLDFLSRLNRYLQWRKRTMCAVIFAALSPVFAFANPDGAQVISGQVTIDQSVAGITTVTNSPNAIINWQNFNIAQNEITRFIQQNGQSAVLNRVIGGDPSQILGQLYSNGKVFLINPNGIIFGAGAQIDTQGLLVSTLNLSDENFKKGNFHFVAGSKAGDITNEGIIHAGKDGNVVLIAPNIQNNGIIKSEGGKIVLAAGQELVLTSLDDPEIRFQVQSPKNRVLNIGQLLTEGGAINVFAGTLKHSGDISADSVEVDKQGNIRLVAKDEITLEKDSKTTANNEKGEAGKIEITGENVAVLDNSKIEAVGKTGGGEILVGGDYQGKNPAVQNAQTVTVAEKVEIKADAVEKGDGGKIVVWSDNETKVAANFSAKGGKKSGDGGLIETSGKQLKVADTTKVSTKAPKGKSGTWLLDPVDFTIAESAGDITPTTLSNNLTSNSVVTVSSSSGASGSNGDIFVNSPVSWSANQLVLNAFRNIDINAILNGSGTAQLALEYGQGALSSGNTATYNVRAPVNLPAGNNFSTKLGSDGATVNYTVITNLGVEGDATTLPATLTLQSLAHTSKLAGNYVLGANIDTSETASWNANAGFVPIGTSDAGNSTANVFTGKFDGLGHTISNLKIARATDYIGLFGASSGVIQNVGLVNVNVSGVGNVAGLLGWNAGGNVQNSYTTGSVIGTGYSNGGLIGTNTAGNVSNSYSTASVSGYWHVGGLVGTNYSAGIVENSYSTGSVSGNTSVGGLIGSSFGGAIANSFWNIQTSGQSASAGGRGLTTAQMTDFTTATTTNSNQTYYPFLLWQNLTLQTISGTAINLANKAIDYAVDGVWRGSTHTDGSGNFSVNSWVGTGNLLVWLSGDTNKAATLTNGSYLTDLKLELNTIYGQKDLDTSTLALAKNSISDSDIPFSFDGLTLTPTVQTLKANNDVLINHAIATNGAAISIKAGKSVAINSGGAISTNGGGIEIVANADPTIDNVNNAHRDTGQAFIQMATGSNLDAGLGVGGVAILVRRPEDSWGITLNSANITGGTISIDGKATSDYDGVFMNQSFLNGSSINITGIGAVGTTGGALSSNGIAIFNSTLVASNLINLSGSTIDYTNAHNVGVYLDTATLNTTSGAITISGTVSQDTVSGGALSNTGVDVWDSTLESGSSMFITGSAQGDNVSASYGNHGVSFSVCTYEQSIQCPSSPNPTSVTSSGIMNITGIAGGSSSTNYGIGTDSTEFFSDASAMTFNGTGTTAGITVDHSTQIGGYINDSSVQTNQTGGINLVANKLNTVNTGTSKPNAKITGTGSVDVNVNSGTAILPDISGSSLVTAFSLDNLTANAITTNGGNISLSSINGDVVVNGVLDSGIVKQNVSVGNGGNIALTAGNDILLNLTGNALLSNVQTDGFGTTTGNAGNITLLANRHITGANSDIFANVEKYQNGSTGGHGGNVSLTATTGSVAVRNIKTNAFQNDTGGTIGRGGDVTITSGTNLSVNGIHALSYGATNNYGQATTLSGGGNVLLDAGQNLTIPANGYIDTRTVNEGTFAATINDTSGFVTLKAKGDIVVNSNVPILTNNDAVTLWSSAGSNYSGNITLNTGSSITTNGGDILFRGGTGTLTTVSNPIDSASRANFITELSNTGAGKSVSHGINLIGTNINAGGGNIEMRAASNYVGIDVVPDTTQTPSIKSVIRTSGAGNIALYGLGGLTGATGSTSGIHTYGATIETTGTGNVTLYGVNSVATGGGNYGLLLDYSSVIGTHGSTTGNVNLTGYGSTSGTLNNNEGVSLGNSSTVNTTTSGGSITVIGSGGSGVSYNIGVNNRTSSLISIGSSTGNLNVTGNGGTCTNTGCWGILAEAGGSYESQDTGSINLTGKGGTGADNSGIRRSSGLIGHASMSGNITLTADTINLGTTETIKSSGQLTITPLTNVGIGIAGGTGTLQIPATYFSTNLANGFSNITIGSSTAGQITVGDGSDVGTGFTALDSITLQGSGIAIDDAINATGQTLTLSSTGNVTQSAPITATDLLLTGGGNFTLNNINNVIANLAASGIGNLNFLNSTAFAIDSINAVNGISAVGTIDISSYNGDLTVNQPVITTNATVDAMRLNAGYIETTTTTANIIVGSSGSFSVGTGGIGKFFTGSILGSTGLANFIPAGNSRYNSDESPSGTHYTTPIASSGKYAIYREQPKLHVTPDSATSIYGDSIVALSGSANSSDYNGDAAFDTISGTPVFTTTATNTSHVGTYDIAYTSGYSSALGYGFEDDTLSAGEYSITPRTLTSTLTNTAVTKTYDGTTDAPVDFTPTYSFTGYATGDSAATLTYVNAFYDSKNVANASKITVSGLALSSITGNGAITDYVLDSTTKEVTADITAKALSITADAKTKTYGSPDPALTYSQIGLISGADSITGSLSRESGEDVRTYTINQGTLSAGTNYTISYTPAIFTITSATSSGGGGSVIPNEPPPTEPLPTQPTPEEIAAQEAARLAAEAAAKAEAEKLAAEEAAKAKAEAEKLAAEEAAKAKAEAEKLAAAEAAKAKAEAEKLAAEEAAKAKAEAEKLAAEEAAKAKAEAEKLAAEEAAKAKAEAEKLAAEEAAKAKAEAEKLAAEEAAKAKAEAEKLAAEEAAKAKAEAEKLAAEEAAKAEAEKLAAEEAAKAEAEAEKLAAEEAAKAKAEAEKLAAEEAAKAKAEAEKLAAEEAAKAKAEAEKLAAEEAAKAEAEKLAAEEAAKAEAEKLAAEEAAKAEAEKLAAEEAAKAKAEAEKLAAEEAAKSKAEAEKLAAEEAAKAKAEAEKLAAEEVAKAKAEAEKLAAEEAAKAEAERQAAEAARIEAERQAAEVARIEAERQAAEVARIEAERQAAEAARIEAERQAAEAARIEAERQAAEAARIEAERQATEVARIEAERQVAEAARIEAERQAAEEAAKTKADNLATEILNKPSSTTTGSTGINTESIVKNLSEILSDVPVEQVKQVVQTVEENVGNQTTTVLTMSALQIQPTTTTPAPSSSTEKATSTDDSSAKNDKDDKKEDKKDKKSDVVIATTGTENKDAKPLQQCK